MERSARVCELKPVSGLITLLAAKSSMPLYSKWASFVWKIFQRTLGLIQTLPAVQQLKAIKHGSPHVDDEDVPEHLRSTAAPAKENDWDTDSNHFARWDWVMEEMIFAFECKVDDSWEEAFRSGDHDIKWIPVDKDGNEVPKGEHKYYQMGKGPKDTYQCDYEGLEAVEKRIQNGLRLFGKYFSALWD